MTTQASRDHFQAAISVRSLELELTLYDYLMFVLSYC